jgi:hypothetical protein
MVCTSPEKTDDLLPISGQVISLAFGGTAAGIVMRTARGGGSGKVGNADFISGLGMFYLSFV